MIQREKVSGNVYFFQSELYAKVNAGVIAGSEWAVAIDTLSYPEETLAIRDFIEQELKVPVRYVINTHYHADHSWGNCFFPGSLVISHQRCRQLLEERGMPSLEQARKHNTIFNQTKIVLPHITFEQGELTLKVDDDVLRLIPLPGHSSDGIGVLIEEEHTLFAGDVFMSLPYVVDGNIDTMVATLNTIRSMGLENIIQGHGDVVLRGEVNTIIDDHLAYLSNIRKIVHRAARREFPGEFLKNTSVESCGKSRILIGGLAEDLHHRNLEAVYQQIYGETPPGFDENW